MTLHFWLWQSSSWLCRGVAYPVCQGQSDVDTLSLSAADAWLMLE